MKPDVKDKKSSLSRRHFLASSGAFLTGAVAAAAGCGMMTKKEEPIKQNLISWPYPYVQLDPEEARIRAYVGYYKGK